MPQKHAGFRRKRQEPYKHVYRERIAQPVKRAQGRGQGLGIHGLCFFLAPGNQPPAQGALYEQQENPRAQKHKPGRDNLFGHLRAWHKAQQRGNVVKHG